MVHKTEHPETVVPGWKLAFSCDRIAYYIPAVGEFVFGRAPEVQHSSEWRPMLNQLRIAIAIVGLLASSGCSARDFVYNIFGDQYRVGESLNDIEREGRFNSELDGQR